MRNTVWAQETRRQEDLCLLLAPVPLVACVRQGPPSCTSSTRRPEAGTLPKPSRSVGSPRAKWTERSTGKGPVADQQPLGLQSASHKMSDSKKVISGRLLQRYRGSPSLTPAGFLPLILSPDACHSLDSIVGTGRLVQLMTEGQAELSLCVGRAPCLPFSASLPNEGIPPTAASSAIRNGRERGLASLCGS
ncbi:hypothetical protein MJT46_015738 [Ovis ammon polii x Ovis aries]|nr:hypothetical protein MJT46_015738 [Ovis ammon polii x Ovis aries]